MNDFINKMALPIRTDCKSKLSTVFMYVGNSDKITLKPQLCPNWPIKMAQNGTEVKNDTHGIDDRLC